MKDFQYIVLNEKTKLKLQFDPIISFYIFTVLCLLLIIVISFALSVSIFLLLYEIAAYWFSF